jgi:hypothetical protein
VANSTPRIHTHNPPSTLKPTLMPNRATEWLSLCSTKDSRHPSVAVCPPRYNFRVLNRHPMLHMWPHNNQPTIVSRANANTCMIKREKRQTKQIRKSIIVVYREDGEHNPPTSYVTLLGSVRSAPGLYFQVT